MGVIAAHGREAARSLFREVLVASASIPGLFPPVIFHVQDDKGVAYDEMHVDGGTTVPFFIVPEAAFFSPLDPNALSGANIYVLLNGQLGAAPSTTRFRSIAILSKSFSAGLKHMLRAQIELASGFAQRYGMKFAIAGIPIDYPVVGSLDFRASGMRALFNYGSSCAEEGRLWATLDQAIARAEGALSVGDWQRQQSRTGKIPLCPLDDSSLASQASSTPG
ncbi:MAG: hypothetical protein JWN85_1418 [Gammaproteobacteria bacterium]|nr:hypothetical protein [Gammaproteobacteria bacterium]